MSIDASTTTPSDPILSEQNQLDSTFMYSKLLKETLLEITYDKESIESFISFLRNDSSNDAINPNIINEFEGNYKPESSIWWYTRKSFIYEILNQALRQLNVDIIINTGFFIDHLHQQIEQLHQQQISNKYHQQPFMVYQGEGLSTMDFERLMQSKGGLVSFNNFLSTSTKKEVCLVSAQSSSTKPDTIGVLFKMIIDPSVCSVPFADIHDISYDKQEHEILFSTHTIFRCNQINKIDNNNSLYEVDLTLTADDDGDLRLLTESLREELVGETGWERLAALLNKLGQFNKAAELYNKLIEQTSDEDQKAQYYDSLGYIESCQGDYEKAIAYYEKALEVFEKTRPSNDSSLATSYNKIGQAYQCMGDFSKALEYYEKELDIRQKTLPTNDADLDTVYNNIAETYQNMGEYSQALSYQKKALRIQQTTLPPIHPLLAATYNKIGYTYKNMQKYAEALSFYNKALEVYENSLPPNHPDLADCYTNIGWIYTDKEDYSNALSNFKRALSILENSLPPGHPIMVTVQEAIDTVEKKL